MLVLCSTPVLAGAELVGFAAKQLSPLVHSWALSAVHKY